jgi:hypothetical protein
VTEQEWISWATALCQEVCALRQLQRHADESSPLSKRGPAYSYRLNTNAAASKHAKFMLMMNACEKDAKKDTRLH